MKPTRTLANAIRAAAPKAPNAALDAPAPIDVDAAWRSLLAHDTGADGRLYVGVTSTGVYCRPICRVRTPRREHCRFFASAAQAEAAAFRPCLKCRPEIAPGPGLPWSVMDAPRTLAVQAAAWLDAHAHDGTEGDAGAAAPGALAARLGISERHLRRIFATTHGVSPLQYVQTRRLLLAKQLLTDSALPVAQVALASGFRSLRRFNAAFVSSYRMNPTRLRGAGRAGMPSVANLLKPGASGVAHGTGPFDAVGATLGFREPLDRDALLGFIARRAIVGVEQVDGAALRRTLRPGLFGATGGWVEAVFDERRPLLRLRYAPSLTPSSGALLQAVRRWLDLDTEPQAIAARLATLPGSAGLRLPGSLDAFELAVCTVLGRQGTAMAARTPAARLVGQFGAPLDTPWPGLDRTFPAPATLAAQTPGALAALGILPARAAAIVALAGAWSDIEPLLAQGTAPARLVEQLSALPGIGAWTAHCVALHALGWADAFPPGDAAVRSAFRLDRSVDAWRAADIHAEAWRPWRAYGVMALWSQGETAESEDAGTAPSPSTVTQSSVGSTCAQRPYGNRSTLSARSLEKST